MSERLIIALLLLALPLFAATESQYPDTIAAQAGFTSCTVDEIDDDPDSPDANWCDVGSSSASNISPTEVRATFPTPTGNPTGTQSFRVQFRKTTPSTNPNCLVELYENGSFVAGVVASTAVSSTSSVVLSGTWSAASLGTANGSLVEAFVNCTHGGGSPGNRAVGEVGAIEWVVDYTAPAARNRID